MIILTQNKQAIWNFDDISRLHDVRRMGHTQPDISHVSPVQV